MKRLTWTVLIATVIIIAFASCDWFAAKKTPASNPLLGKWKIDSIYTPNDSTGFGYLLLAMTLNDSAAYDYEFKQDSVVFYSKSPTPQLSVYTFDTLKKEISIKGEGEEVYRVLPINDSLVSLKAKDSSIVFLKRR